MIKLKINGVEVASNQVKFSDGASSFTLEGTLPQNPVKALISAKPSGSLPDLFFEIAQAVDVLRQLNNRIEINLLMPYVPYARQDRSMQRNDAFSLKVFASLLNSLNLDKVVVVDAHSTVSCALINNVVEIEQHQLIGSSNVLHCLLKGYVLVAPDAGSLKKIGKVAELIKPSGNVILGKERDTTTGMLSNFRIVDSDLSSLEGRKCLIVDDLCDGGGTFIGAANVLKQAGASQVDLFVSHGIFSRGVENLLDNGISHIFTTNSFADVTTNPDVTVFPLEYTLNNSFYSLGIR